jgi:hypothetical protein
MKKLLLALGLWLGLTSGALAQNPTCPTRPPGDSSNACASTAFVGNAVGGSGILSTNNTWTGDNFFGSGRPWCDVRAKGAVGDGVTNDAVAFRSCVTTLVALGGGTLYVPPSTNPYCVVDGTSGVLLTSTTAFIRILGVDEANSVLSACGNNSFPVVRMNTPHSALENVYVLGYGMRSTDTFGIAANPAVHFQSLCSFCRIMNSTVNGGNFNVQLENSNYLFLNVTAQYAYSTALIYAKNGGGAFDGGNHFNQVWPVSVPAHNATLNAWAGTSACSAGQVVSTAGFYIQYTGAGTTGGSAPTLKNYGQSITDGSCSAFLVGPTTYYAIQADSGTNEMQILHTDMTGAFTAGLAMTNTLATIAPTSVSVSESTIGQTTVSAIFASSGSELSVNNVHISRCIAVGCVGVNLTNSWSGPANITGLRVFNNVSYGIFIGAGTEANVVNSYVYTADLSSITVGANINRFNILGSSLCTSSLGTSTNAITVTAGTSNFYNIIGNDTNGCSSTGIVDNGSGTSKLIGGIGPWTVANGGTGLQAGTSGGMPYFNSTSTIASSGALATNDIMVGGGTSGPSTGTGCSIANSSVVCASSASAFPQFTLTNTTSDAVAPAFLWRKSRSGGNTLTSDFLADLEFYGFANAALSITGRIQAQQTAASSGSNIPSKLIFSTSNAAGQINQTLSFDGNSHLSNAQVTAPTVTAGCNGAGSSVAGTDLAGTVTGQTAAATTCTLTFGTAFASAPNCTVTGQSSPLTGAVTVATGTLVVNFASTANYKWSYTCYGT